MRIQLLDQLLINQIAAGEIIERPASIVKELLENSLDAKASEITVWLDKAGHTLIKVIDNGIGIQKDELELALVAHATSKIYTLEDLENVNTLGFRGEAPASIASIARVTLTSRPASYSYAFQINKWGPQEVFPMQPAAYPIGTCIEVRDIFFNTPARKAFLKNDATEFAHSLEIFKKIALSHYAIGFTLYTNSQLLYQLKPAVAPKEQLMRIQTLGAKNFASTSFIFEAASESLIVKGFLANPTRFGPKATMQWIYINQRFVRDRAIQHAVFQAYKEVIGHDYPCNYIIYLTLDPSLIDVNVHPTKAEVRFKDSRAVYGFIMHTLKEQLRANQTFPLLSDSVKPNISPLEPVASIKAMTSSLESPDVILNKKSVPYQLGAFDSPTAGLYRVASQDFAPSQTLTPPLGYALAQLKTIYILAENDQGLVIVDIHAAHERLLYEKLTLELTQSGIQTQALLMPLCPNVSSELADLVELHAHSWLSIGVELQKLAPEKVALRTFPALLPLAKAETIIENFLKEWYTYGTSTVIAQDIHRLLATLACETALCAQTKLSLHDMNSLLRQIEITPRTHQCNHGRLTYKSMSIIELDKWFLRGQ